MEIHRGKYYEGDKRLEVKVSNEGLPIQLYKDDMRQIGILPKGEVKGLKVVEYNPEKLEELARTQNADIIAEFMDKRKKRPTSYALFSVTNWDKRRQLGLSDNSAH